MVRNKRNIFLGISILIIIVILFSLEITKLESMYYVTQIIGILFVALGVLIALRQYILTSRNEIIKFENEQVQKSIDLAEYYKNNILYNMVIINHVYDMTGMLKILDRVEKSKMKSFDNHELNEIFSTADLDELKKIIMSDKYCEAVALVGKNYNINVLEKSAERDKNGNIVVGDDGNTKFKLKVNKTKVHHLFINKILVETLNNLEYFSMHFTYNTADESVVYQSLHKTYLNMVRLLYYNIAINNKTGGSKVFTNVIELFNLWDEKSQVIKEEEVNLSRGMASKGKKAKAS